MAASVGPRKVSLIVWLAVAVARNRPADGVTYRNQGQAGVGAGRGQVVGVGGERQQRCGGDDAWARIFIYIRHGAVAGDRTASFRPYGMCDAAAPDRRWQP